MKLILWRWIMFAAWIIDGHADSLVEWAQQKYSNELHGIGSID